MIVVTADGDDVWRFDALEWNIGLNVFRQIVTLGC